jgi:hypothetical protein
MSDTFEVANGDVRLRVSGLRTTVRDLERAGADTQDMRQLIHTVGMIVVRAATAPVRSGKLEGTIRAGRGKTKAVVRAGGARAPYAGVIHYGWPARGIQAQPFLVDALQAQRNNVLQALETGIDEILRKNNLS